MGGTPKKMLEEQLKDLAFKKQVDKEFEPVLGDGKTGTGCHRIRPHGRGQAPDEAGRVLDQGRYL